MWFSRSCEGYVILSHVILEVMWFSRSCDSQGHVKVMWFSRSWDSRGHVILEVMWFSRSCEGHVILEVMRFSRACDSRGHVIFGTLLSSMVWGFSDHVIQNITYRYLMLRLGCYHARRPPYKPDTAVFLLSYVPNQCCFVNNLSVWFRSASIYYEF